MHIWIKNVFVIWQLMTKCICGGDFLGGGLALLTNGGLAAVADQLKSENKTRN